MYEEDEILPPPRHSPYKAPIALSFNSLFVLGPE